MMRTLFFFHGTLLLVIGLCILNATSERVTFEEEPRHRQIFIPQNVTRVTNSLDNYTTVLNSSLTDSGSSVFLLAQVRSCHGVVVKFSLALTGLNAEPLEVNIHIDIFSVKSTSIHGRENFDTAERLLSCHEARPFWFQWTRERLVVGRGFIVAFEESIIIQSDHPLSHIENNGNTDDDSNTDSVIQGVSVQADVISEKEASDWLIITEGQQTGLRKCSSGKLKHAAPAWFYLSYTSSCYGVLRNPKVRSWSEAKRRCSEYGGMLVSINSWQEMLFITQFMSPGNRPPTGLFDMGSDKEELFYIGLKKEKGNQSNFFWDDKNPFSFMPNQMQPDSSSEVQCVVMLYEKEVYKARWKLVPCNIPAGVICKMSDSPEGEPLQPNVDIKSGIKSRLFRCRGDDSYVSSDVICDGIPNCEDKSDESEKLCATVRTQFNQNRTVSRVKTLCPFTHIWTERGECQVREVPQNGKPKKKFTNCVDGQVMPSYRCVFHGSPRCPDSTDLLNCEKFSCPDGHRRCSTGKYCINPETDSCNDENEAPPDEMNCTGMYRCSDRSACIPLSMVCDGKFDCAKDDEEFCNVPCLSGCTCIGTAFTCHRTGLREFPRVDPRATYLDASKNNISQVATFDYNLAITYLNLSHNQIDILKTGDFELLEKIVTLDLSYNKIRSIGNSLHNLHEMKELYLSRNLITSVTDSFEGLPNIILLDLSHNLISHLDAHICVMELSLLDMSYNIIDELAQCHLGESNVMLTNLKGNPLGKVNRRKRVSVEAKRIIRMPVSSACCKRTPWLECHPMPDREECDRYNILSWKTLAVFALVAGLISVLGNGFITWCGTRLMMKDQTNTTSYILPLAMTVSFTYLSICVIFLGVMDIWNRTDEKLIPRLWSESLVCHVFGFNYFLALLSSHCISMLHIFFIYRSHMSTRPSIIQILTSLGCVLAASLLICTVPLLYPGEQLRFYGQSNRCVPLLPPTHVDTATQWLQLVVHLFFFSLPMALMLAMSITYGIQKYSKRLPWQNEDTVMLGLVLSNLVRFLVMYSARAQDRDDYESLVAVIVAAPAFFNPMLVGRWIKGKYQQAIVNSLFNQNIGAVQTSVSSISSPFSDTPLPPLPTLPFSIKPNSLYESYDDMEIYGSTGCHNIYDNLYEPINNMVENSVYAGLDYNLSMK